MGLSWLEEEPEKTAVADRRIIGTDENGVENVLLCVPGDELTESQWKRIQEADNDRVRTAKQRSPRSR